MDSTFFKEPLPDTTPSAKPLAGALGAVREVLQKRKWEGVNAVSRWPPSELLLQKREITPFI